MQYGIVSKSLFVHTICYFYSNGGSSYMYGQQENTQVTKYNEYIFNKYSCSTRFV
jgi:hypothetical protein